MIVQIYEVTTSAEARALGAMGVDHIGVLVGDGSFPREQTTEKAQDIFAAIPPESKALLLSLSDDPVLIARITHELKPGILHLARRRSTSRPRRCEHSKPSFRGPR